MKLVDVVKGDNVFMRYGWCYCGGRFGVKSTGSRAGDSWCRCIRYVTTWPCSHLEKTNQPLGLWSTVLDVLKSQRLLKFEGHVHVHSSLCPFKHPSRNRLGLES